MVPEEVCQLKLTIKFFSEATATEVWGYASLHTRCLCVFLEQMMDDNLMPSGRGLLRDS